MSHQSASSTGTASGTDVAAPDKGRWLLVGAALLLQFSIGAVYAWSVFSSALQDEDAAPDWGLSKVAASLPFV